MTQRRVVLAFASVVFVTALGLGGAAAQSGVGFLSGRVVGPGGAPASGALVIVGTPDLSQVFAQVTAGPDGGWGDGLFEVRGLPAGRPLWVVALDGQSANVGVLSFTLGGRAPRRIEIQMRFPLTVQGVASGLLEGWANGLIDKAIGSNGALQEILKFAGAGTQQSNARGAFLDRLRGVVQDAPDEHPAYDPPASPATPAPTSWPPPPPAPAPTVTTSSAPAVSTPPAPEQRPTAAPRPMEVPPPPVIPPSPEFPAPADPVDDPAEAGGVTIFVLGLIAEVMGGEVEIEVTGDVSGVEAGLKFQVLDSLGAVIATGALTTGSGTRFIGELSESSSLESVRVGSTVRVLVPQTAETLVG